MKNKLLIILICLGFLCSCGHSASVKKESENNHHFNPFKSIVQFYRGPLNHLTSVRRGECPMYPSCSQYSLQAFEKHGAILGWIMTCDRLMRCGRDETVLSEQILVNEKQKCYDPLKKNDFWWNFK